MWDILLQNLPLVIILILAVIICGADLIKAGGVWKKKRQEKIDEEVNKNNRENELAQTLKALQQEVKNANQKLAEQDARFSKIETRLDDLTNSDMHDIKSWIKDQYQKFYVEQGWIDAYSADIIDHRYEDYKKEGGNSFIDTLIERLHTLPMDPKDAFKKR